MTYMPFCPRTQFLIYMKEARIVECSITLACPIRESKRVGVETFSRSFSMINQSVNVTFVSGAVLTVRDDNDAVAARRTRTFFECYVDRSSNAKLV